jgi:hypothetical protein
VATFLGLGFAIDFAILAAMKRDLRRGSPFLNTMREVSLRIFIIFLFQTLFNYSAFFYELDKSQPLSGAIYTDVIARDFSARSQTKCYLARIIFHDESALQFFSWL